jgi:hypothetical protein
MTIFIDVVMSVSMWHIFDSVVFHCTKVFHNYLINMLSKPLARNSYGRGRISTVDLLVQTNLDKLHIILKNIYFSNKTSYLKKVNCTLPSRLVRLPALRVI